MFAILVLLVAFVNIGYAKQIPARDIKKENYMKFIYDAKEESKIDCINYEIWIEEEDYNNADYTKQNMDGDYSETFLYKLIFKKNNETIKNSLVFFNGWIYGTDNDGRIIKDGICSYKGKHYISKGQRGIAIEESDRIITINNKKYYVDKNANVFTGDKLFLKDTGIEYTFNKDHEIIERKEEFSIIEKNGNQYISNYEKYNLDFYVVDKKGYLIEADGKIKKFGYEKPTFVEFKTYNNGKEEINLRRFVGDSFYINSEQRINLYLSNDKTGMVAFDDKGFLVKNKPYRAHYEDLSGAYILYDITGKEIEGEEGLYEVNGKMYYKKGVFNGEIANNEFYKDKKDNMYYADENSELVKNKTIANIFVFDNEYKLTNNYDIKNMESYIAARFSFFNNYVRYFNLVNN